MSATLARRIRRIGILPTTYKESTETYLKKNEEGKEVEATRTRRTPIRHRSSLTAEQIEAEKSQITAAWRANRKKNRSAKPEVKAA